MFNDHTTREDRIPEAWGYGKEENLFEAVATVTLGVLVLALLGFIVLVLI